MGDADRTIERTGQAYGLEPVDDAGARAFTAAFHERLGRAVPVDVRRYAAFPGLGRELARACDAQAVFPELLQPATTDLGPGLRGNELWLMTENQGVCVWAVPLDQGDHPPVLVAGDLQDLPTARVYAPDLDTFVAAWAWDRACAEGMPLIQAQAAPLDRATEEFLRSHLRERVSTWAWPSRRTLRFESSEGLRISLWDDADQCDWQLSGPSVSVVAAGVRALLPYSDLVTSFWSIHDVGEDLLRHLIACHVGSTRR
jgi:hypothetical protein